MQPPGARMMSSHGKAKKAEAIQQNKAESPRYMLCPRSLSYDVDLVGGRIPFGRFRWSFPDAARLLTFDIPGLGGSGSRGFGLPLRPACLVRFGLTPGLVRCFAFRPVLLNRALVLAAPLLDRRGSPLHSIRALYVHTLSLGLRTIRLCQTRLAGSVLATAPETDCSSQHTVSIPFIGRKSR